MKRPGILSRPICVATDHIPQDIRTDIARRFGLAPKDGDAFAVFARRPDALLMSGLDGESLEQVLHQPFSGYVELVDENEIPGDRLWASLAAQSFYLSLTTATAIGLRGAVLVCDALHGRGILSKERRPNVELCLHEAVANALVHGNLGVPSAQKTEPERYRQYSQMIGERLQNEEARRRRVEIFARWSGTSLHIGVADQGAGFELSALNREVDEHMPSGRGFMFMRTLADTVTVTDGGRCTSLCFAI